MSIADDDMPEQHIPPDSEVRMDYAIDDFGFNDDRAATFDAWLAAHDARVRSETEARIRAVEEVLDEMDSDQHIEWVYDGVRGASAAIRRALNGDA